MDIAYLINNNGERLVFNADNDNCRNFKGRLICPCCGELVDWVDGQRMVRHFRHRRSTYRKECENYCASISDEKQFSPYEVRGLELYLIEDLGRYSLRIGLRAIDSFSIREAERMKLVVNIENNREIIGSKEINFEYFVPDAINFIHINHVSEQYKLKFSNERVPKEIKNRWNENINGIGNMGAIFSSHSYGGKKVNTSKGIVINEEYLLFTKKEIDYNQIKGAIFNKVQVVDFGWLKKYYVFKFILKEKNNSTLEFARKFDLELKYKQEEIIPIWPPCSILEDELIYNNVENEKFFILNTDNPIQNKLYSYKLQKELTSQYIENGKYLVNSYIKSNDYILIGSLDNLSYYSIVKRTDLTNKVDPNIEIKVLNNIVNINTDVKLFLNLYLDNYLLKSEIITNENYSIRVKRGEKIEVLYGLDIIWENSNKPERNILEDNNQKDKELLFKIKKCKGEFISVPTNLKWKILKLKDYDLSYKELIKRVKNGKISAELVNLIKESI